MKTREIQEAIIKIKKKMADAPGTENIRVLVSTHLTKILMLFGRLDNDYNPRYLPVTLNSILLIISELDLLQSRHAECRELLKENIERREKYSSVFMIPQVLVLNPTVSGLQMATQELAAPVVKNYCKEERLFLTTLAEPVSSKTRVTLFSRTKRSCDLLMNSCYEADRPELKELRNWCESQLGAALT